MVSERESIERAAAAWLSKRDGGNWSAAEQGELDRWLEASAANAVAFIRLEAAWNKADRYRALGAGLRPLTVPEPEELNRSPFFEDPLTRAKGVVREMPPEGESGAIRTRRLRVSLGLAATLVMVVAGALLWHWRPFSPSYRTPVGGTASVPMKDGSRVTLNTDSEIHVAIDDRERNVRLEHGEAFFEVAKDPRRPFIVEAGSKRIVVVGTQFSVRRHGDDVRVVVTEGKVRLEDTGAVRIAAVDANGKRAAGSGAFLLGPGEVARSGVNGLLVRSAPLAEAQEALSWRTGFVVFRDVDLVEAVTEFNRYNEKKIVIADPALATIRLSGKFKAANADAFVRLLEEGFPVAAADGGANIVLSARPR